MKAFKNTSIFQGWVQYKDESGQEWRAQHDGRLWIIYRLIDDSFVHAGGINAPKNAGPRQIHNKFQKILIV